MLLFRLLLAPLLVVAASLVARRLGERAGGWLSAFPFVGFPVHLLLYLDHGTAFTVQSAKGALYGVALLGVFSLAYAWTSRRLPWEFSLAVAWGLYLTFARILEPWDASLWLRIALSLAGPLFLSRLLPLVRNCQNKASPLPPWDIWLRTLSAFALVAGIALASKLLGPSWSGLLTPFPVITAILAVFAHSQVGSDAVVRIFQGFLPGLLSLCGFFATLALALPFLGAAAFGLALFVAVAAQVATLRSVA